MNYPAIRLYMRISLKIFIKMLQIIMYLDRCTNKEEMEERYKLCVEANKIYDDI